MEKQLLKITESREWERKDKRCKERKLQKEKDKDTMRER